MKADKIRAQALQLAREESEKLEQRKKALEAANIPHQEYQKRQLALEEESRAIWELLGRLT